VRLPALLIEVDQLTGFSAAFAHAGGDIITLRAGRWLHFRDFANSALALQVFAQ
jgi:hypothetical protein